MRSLFVLVSVALLGSSVAACGSSDSSNSSSTHRSTTVRSASVESATPYTKTDRDQDNDVGAGRYDDANNNVVFDYGRAASKADRRAITALIKHYYTLAAAGDGAKACSMLYITLSESVAEDYGRGSPGPTYLRQGTTCPSVMDLLFKHYHGKLLAELPQLKVIAVRLNHRQGLAILSFGPLPERRISVREQRQEWKLASLLDSELP